MNDEHGRTPTSDASTGSPSRSGTRSEQGLTSDKDAFTQALLDVVTSHQPTVALSKDESALIVAFSEWAPGLPEAVDKLEDDETSLRTPVRADDPVARMLGLVEDPAVRLDGRRLATVRKAAGLDIADLSNRLQQRGWGTSVSIVFAWERGKVNPPPATINAIAEVLGVPTDDVLAKTPGPAQTIDILFDDQTIAIFFDEWAQETNVSAVELVERSKRLLATAGKRNATSATPQTLLAILKHFRSLPGFEGSP